MIHILGHVLPIFPICSKLPGLQDLFKSMIEEVKKRMDMNMARLSRSSRFDPLQVSSESCCIQMKDVLDESS